MPVYKIKRTQAITVECESTEEAMDIATRSFWGELDSAVIERWKVEVN